MAPTAVLATLQEVREGTEEPDQDAEEELEDAYGGYYGCTAERPSFNGLSGLGAYHAQSSLLLKEWQREAPSLLAAPKVCIGLQLPLSAHQAQQ